MLLFLIASGICAQDVRQPNKVPGAEKGTGEVLAILWENPADISTRDLRYGEGGPSQAPQDTVFTFVKEDMSGSNPKFIVTDQAGGRWKVKLGAEAKPEVAASRFVWAIGYFTNEDYYLPKLRITGLPGKLHRGRQYFSADGAVRDARLQRMDKAGSSKEGTWQWKRDPFSGTREWNGLRVLMALMNNWDLKDVNNKVISEKAREPRKIYLVSDLGASFGTTGLALGLRRSRGNLGSFKNSRFITKVSPQYVDFATPSRATLFAVFDPHQFFLRLHLRWIGKQVPLADVKWMAGILVRLSPEQIRDAFRAAGYSPEEVEGFAKIIENRISSLNDI